MKPEELKPCPFCGSNVSFCHDISGEITGIRCPACKSMTKFYGLPIPKKSETFGETMSRWAEKWNQRVNSIGFH